MFDKNNNGLVPGDIGLIEGGTWVSKGILFFMNLYRKTKKLKTRKLYTHAFAIVKVFDKLFIAEMSENGAVVKPFVEAYGNKIDRIKFLSPNKPYTNKEKEMFSETAISYSFDATRYDFIGLWDQMVYVTTGKWKGKTGDKAEKRMYCTEAVATWANKVRPNTFKNQHSVNPLDIDLNENYKEKNLK